MKKDAEKKIRGCTYLIVSVDWVGCTSICESCRGKKQAEELRAYWERFYEEDIQEGRCTIVIYKAQ